MPTNTAKTGKRKSQKSRGRQTHSNSDRSNRKNIALAKNLGLHASELIDDAITVDRVLSALGDLDRDSASGPPGRADTSAQARLGKTKRVSTVQARSSGRPPVGKGVEAAQDSRAAIRRRDALLRLDVPTNGRPR